MIIVNSDLSFWIFSIKFCGKYTIKIMSTKTLQVAFFIEINFYKYKEFGTFLQDEELFVLNL